ncbi:MAG: DUF4177 domain-containing protein [Planctomycetota bacterium]|jgi:hypothetical protein|nr:DUF4177 domain-containing protein [Planctomycetota bacterium]MDP6940658.1 DUF4177 domain-containing protein [Planctomycetota bacterium]
MTKWEYKSIVGLLNSSGALGGLLKGWNLKAETNDTVKDLGEEGWEMVSITSINVLGFTKNVLMIFKRPKESS